MLTTMRASTSTYAHKVSHAAAGDYPHTGRRPASCQALDRNMRDFYQPPKMSFYEDDDWAHRRHGWPRGQAAAATDAIPARAALCE